VVTERTVVAQAGRPDPESEEPFGHLRGHAVDLRDESGARIHVEVEECTRANQANLTLVFCHGYALNQDCFHYQRRDLRALGRLVFYDQRSHGRSDRTPKETNTIEQLGRDLYQIICEVVPEGPILLVGHSMGGMTVMALALAHPELFGPRIRGVALLATSPGGLQDVSLGLPQFAARPLHRLLPVTTSVLVRKANLVEMGRSRVNDLSLLFTKYYSFGSNASPAVAEFCHQILGRTPIDVISEFLTTLQQHQRHRALDVIDELPVTIMVGEDDRMTPAGHSQAMAVEIPDAELTVLPDTGHMLILERYAEVNSALRRLAGQVLDRLDGPPSGVVSGPAVRA
jgi:pimeloyl-ACP methyl ester carboxylesterase